MPGETAKRELVDSVIQLSFLVQAVLARAAAAHELTVAQVRLLGILRDREPSMMQLAQHLGLDKSSVTGLIDRAERRGLVQRTASAQDGRAITVSVTPLGRQLIERAGDEIDAQVTAIAGPLSTADRDVLSRLAARIVQATDIGALPGQATGVASAERPGPR